MQYFQQASETAATDNVILCTLTSERIVTDSGSFIIRLTNDMSKVTKEFRTNNLFNYERYDALVFKLCFTEAEEDLDNGIVHFEPTGSYTYVILDSFLDRIMDKGKAVLYPHGEYKTATKFGNEVTYTEHQNPTTNTIYVNI